jgi:hypothetical protein
MALEPIFLLILSRISFFCMCSSWRQVGELVLTVKTPFSTPFVSVTPATTSPTISFHKKTALSCFNAVSIPVFSTASLMAFLSDYKTPNDAKWNRLKKPLKTR